VGGAGANAVDRLKMENLERLQLAVINTDYQALSSSPVQEKLLIGMSVTRGLGAGGDPDLGREAAEADREKNQPRVVKDCDLVSSSSAAWAAARAAARLPFWPRWPTKRVRVVIAFVTMPFSVRGRTSLAAGRGRPRRAAQGL
jgi:cell division protein FtsZ